MRIPLGIAVSLLVVSSLAAHPQDPASAVRSLFRDTQAVPAPGVGREDTAVRQRIAALDAALLRSGVSVLRLDLFPDVTLVARLRSADGAYGDGTTWAGGIDGAPEGSSALFSVTGDVVAGSIRVADRLYRIGYAGNGVHRISELDESRTPRCGGAVVAPRIGAPVRAGERTADGGHETPDGANPILDALVVYSTVAKNSQGGAASMNSLINLAIAETNQAYANSSINQRLTLVHTAEMVGYSEPSSFSRILSDLRGKADGRMDNVHQLRDQYGADVVAMIVNNGQYCGIAYLMTSVSAAFEDRAFSVTNRGCATGYYSFGHEIGHNCGSAHDPGSAGSAAYSYSYGFRTSNNQYRTIMAYAPGTRVQVFSGPSSRWAGYTMGNGSQDNARSMNNTANTTSSWRTGAPPQGPTLTVNNFVAGQTASLVVDNCSPNRVVQLGYSLFGAGPTQIGFGALLLSQPFKLLPAQFANGAGTATFPLAIPAPAVGRVVWMHSLDVYSRTFSNGVQATVQ